MAGQGKVAPVFVPRAQLHHLLRAVRRQIQVEPRVDLIGHIPQVLQPAHCRDSVEQANKFNGTLEIRSQGKLLAQGHGAHLIGKMPGRRRPATEAKQVKLQAVQGVGRQQVDKPPQALAQQRAGLVGLAQHPGTATTIAKARKRAVGRAGGGADTADIERGHRLTIAKGCLHGIVLVQASDIGRSTGITAARIDLQALRLTLQPQLAVVLIIGGAIEKNTDTQYVSRIA